MISVTEDKKTPRNSFVFDLKGFILSVRSQFSQYLERDSLKGAIAASSFN
jgi:hypothetical protein